MASTPLTSECSHADTLLGRSTLLLACLGSASPVRFRLRAPRGNQNAFKHGRYTIEATANRREIAALLRNMKALAKGTE